MRAWSHSEHELDPANHCKQERRVLARDRHDASDVEPRSHKVPARRDRFEGHENSARQWHTKGSYRLLRLTEVEALHATPAKHIDQRFDKAEPGLSRLLD